MLLLFDVANRLEVFAYLRMMNMKCGKVVDIHRI